MELHNIPATKENIEQFSNYRNRNAKLLTQAQDTLKSLVDMIDKLPEGAEKQTALQELAKQLGIPIRASISEQAAGTIPQAQDTPQAFVSPSATQAPPQDMLSASGAGTSQQGNSALPADSAMVQPDTSAYEAAPDNATAHPQAASIPGQTIGQTASTMPDVSTAHARPLPAHNAPLDGKVLLRDFLDSFLLKPEELSDPERVQEYYEELNEKIIRMERLSDQLSETTKETGTSAPKQMRQNLSFMEAVNQVFPFIQLPLKFREHPAHGELYVYEKKRSLKPSDTLSALLHLELEALGTTDIFVTLAGSHVTTRFSMTDKASETLIRTELPSLTRALAAKGYTHQSEVTLREPSDEATPTLLEQFLEEKAPGGLNRYTFDIRA